MYENLSPLSNSRLKIVPCNGNNSNPSWVPKNGVIHYTLDNIAQLRSLARSSPVLHLRQRAKYFTSALCLGLINNNQKSNMLPSYWRSYHCNRLLHIGENGITAKRCKNRWCIVCSRIATAEKMAQYLPAFEEFDSPYFITLTAKTVSCSHLRNRIDEMGAMFRKILDRRSNRGRFKGVRKLECTYRPLTNRYHPHYHVIVDGKAAADLLRKCWLELHGDRANIQANDVRQADVNSLRELCKYATKLSVSLEDNEFYPQALDRIFFAMRGVRSIQPFGKLIGKKSAKEVREEHRGEIEGNIHFDMEDYGMYEWFQCDGNWINDSEKCLSLNQVEEKIKVGAEKFGR